MCGISGVYTKNNSLIDEYGTRLAQALEQISYRGPDDSGCYRADNAVLGHVRLSIIDLSDAGHQPMTDKTQDHVLVYNGEVYNYKALKSQLELTDGQLQSSSDTEVVLESFKQYGTKSFELFNGMYAFSLLDKKANKAYIVRDRLGIKPLYYYCDQDSLFFASEIKAISTMAGKEPQMNDLALSEWAYYGSAIRENTFFQGCQKLLPGHYIEIDLDSMAMKVIPYWLPENVKPLSGRVANGRADATTKIKELLETAVCRQLVGDVPVGVFLSGGIDSSAITAFASKHYSGKIKTFSVGFDFDKGVNELPKAKKVAEKFGTEHHELTVSGYDLADTLELLVEHHDSPFSDAANIPLYLLGKKVNNDIKVVLQGDGGDELFAGYKRYQTLASRRFWRPFVAGAAAVHSMLPSSRQYYTRQRYFNALNSPDDAELMALLLTVEDKAQDPHLIFSPQIRQRLVGVDPFQSFRDCDKRFAHLDIVQKMLYTDTQIILPDIFLEKVDRSTMAASIEVRVPFLDSDLVDYALSLPSEYKIRGGVKKALLIDALEGIVPDEILHGPKTGFSVPYQNWLAGPLKALFYDKVAQLENRGCDVLDFKHIRKMMAANLSGERDHAFMLWKVLNLMIWLGNNRG